MLQPRRCNRASTNPKFSFFTILNSHPAMLLAASIFLLAGALQSAKADTIAFDMVGSSSQNLNSYTNPYSDAFVAGSDGFQNIGVACLPRYRLQCWMTA